MISLYDFLRISDKDYDTLDTEYDIDVTVCWIGEESDNYDKFCNDIMKKVNVERIAGEFLVVDWSRLIKDNIEEFKRFTLEHWHTGYEDDIDEFIYQWIREVHYYMAGYVSDDFYKNLVELVKSELNELVKLSDDDIEKIISSVIKKHSDSKKYDSKKDQVNAITQRLNEIDKIISKLYEDSVTGKIDDERFERMITNYTDEANKLKIQLESLEEESLIVKNKEDDYHKFFELIKKYTEFEELTEETVRMFIERIEIGEKILPEGYKVASHKETQYKQNIKIKYRFIDPVLQEISNTDVEKEVVKT